MGNWETRCFWYNGEFLYAIANMAAVSTADGAERIISGNEIPKEFLENAKRIGRQAIANLPPLETPTGQTVPMTMMRTDIGCSDSKIDDVQTNWDPKKKTFFLNEIEPTSTTYFVRHLKFDCIPMYAKLFAEKAREIHASMRTDSSTRSRTQRTPMQKATANRPVTKKTVMKATLKKTVKGAKKQV